MRDALLIVAAECSPAALCHCCALSPAGYDSSRIFSHLDRVPMSLFSHGVLAQMSCCRHGPRVWQSGKTALTLHAGPVACATMLWTVTAFMFFTHHMHNLSMLVRKLTPAQVSERDANDATAGQGKSSMVMGLLNCRQALMRHHGVKVCRKPTLAIC